MEFSKEEATKFFSDYYGGEHHFPNELQKFGYGWMMRDNRGDLATFDFTQLTLLVVMAHDRCIRVSIMPHTANMIKISIHKRDREAKSMSERHPTLEDNVAKIREWLKEKELTTPKKEKV